MLRQINLISNTTDKIGATIIFIFILLFITNSQIKSQNLVSNSSFEEFVDFSKNNESSWHKVQESDTPDYFNFSSDAPHNTIFNKYMGNITAKSGEGFVGIFCYRVSSTRGIRNIREFVESPLQKRLGKDSLYKIELSVRLDIESNIAIKNIGVYFSDDLCSNDPKFNPFSILPQVEFNAIFLDSANNWITLRKLYKANGNETNIIIGNFKSDKKTNRREVYYKKGRGKRYKWDLIENESAAYYYIDDVIVEKIPLNKKANDKVVEIIDTLTRDSLFNIDKINVDSVIVLKNIIFEFNKSDLLLQSYVELNKLKQLMVNNPNIKIMLEGHTDNVGDYNFNLKLSIERVEAVTAYLIKSGIAPERIEYAGYSYSKPLVPNDSEEGRRINRRVAFKIISK